MAPSADLGKEKAHRQTGRRMPCYATKVFLGFALFTTVTDVGGGRQIFNDM